MKLYKSHGTGDFNRSDFKYLGSNVVFESGVKVFHPENIIIQDNVYIGHNTILKGYYKNTLSIGENTWIGQDCFFHSAGGLEIESNVGIGPKVSILTSNHILEPLKGPILFQPIEFRPVIIRTGVDIGIGSTILPGVSIGEFSQIGSMTLINKDVDRLSVCVGVPFRVIRKLEIQ